jgi:hypothetical protein
MAYGMNGTNGNEIVHPPVNDSVKEIASMANFPNIRLMRFGKQSSLVPMLEPVPADRGDEYTEPVAGWSHPCPGGKCRADFSAMCWFFGRNVYTALADAGSARPIGLIGVYWGGTSDEQWSSQDALDKCINTSQPDPKQSTTLWNGMLHPLLNQTIKGVTWYQGEADASHPGGRYDGYNCTFPEMIRDCTPSQSRSQRPDLTLIPPFLPANPARVDGSRLSSLQGEPSGMRRAAGRLPQSFHSAMCS